MLDDNYENIVIEGGYKLRGEVKISGSKNAALPIIAATILSNEKITLNNIPHLDDISTMCNLLLDFGAEIEFTGHGSNNFAQGKSINIRANNINNTLAHYDIVHKMRASILVLGPLLTKYGKAKVSLPGGCAIGTRPVDLHLMALEQLGATIKLEEGYVIANSKNGLNGNIIEFPVISVGATENAIMAATLAKGTTIIKNAAIEPEIIDLISFLKKMGSKIEIKERIITIEGVKYLGSATHDISADRIEAGSYAVATLATKGKVKFLNVDTNIFNPIEDFLIDCGAVITKHKKDNNNQFAITIEYKNNIQKNKRIHIKTNAYPQFPTDMQAQFAALLTQQNKESVIEETIFENRFMYSAELKRMGAVMSIDGNCLNIKPSSLNPAQVTASDLRASMALVIAALTCKGKTQIRNIYHLDRGYELLEEKLSRCGAKIYRGHN